MNLIPFPFKFFYCSLFLSLPSNLPPLEKRAGDGESENALAQALVLWIWPYRKSFQLGWSFHEVEIDKPGKVHYWQNPSRSETCASPCRGFWVLSEEEWKDPGYPRGKSIANLREVFILQFNYWQRLFCVEFLILLEDTKFITNFSSKLLDCINWHLREEFKSSKSFKNCFQCL